MTRKLLFIFFLLTVWTISFAQTVFEKSYEVDINNEFNYISQLMLLPDSSYLFSTTAYDNSDNFLLLGKIDHLGNVVWIKQVNDSFQISQANFALSENNELYLAYSAINGNPSRYYSVVLKMDLSGNLIWSKSYGDSTRSQYCEHIFLTATSIFLAGETYSASPSDLYMIKLDIAGNYKWGMTYEAGGIDYLRDATQLSNQDILLSGLTRDSVNHYFNSIFRIDTTGAIVWHKRFHLPSYKEFNSQAINEDYDGTLLITGHTDTIDVSSKNQFGLWDMSIMKLSATGNFIWAKIYGGSDFDEVWEVLPTDDHGFIFAAEPESFGNVSRIGLMKTDSAGDVDWMKLYGKATGGFPNNIVINHDKGYTILATNGDYGVMAPMVFIRTDSLGASICPDSFVILPKRSFTPIDDTIGGLGFLSGIAPFTPLVSNYPLVAKEYCNPNLIRNISADYFLKVYPNPFSNQLTFSLANNEQTTVSLYNFLGQQILRQTFTNSTTVNTEQFVDGIYFYELRGNKGILKTGKLVKQ